MTPRSNEARRQQFLWTLTCWAAAGFVAVIAFAALLRSDSWSFIQAVFASGVILLALGVLFAFLFARPLPGPVIAAGAVPAPAAAAAPEPEPPVAPDEGTGAADPATTQAATLATLEDLQRIRGIGPKLALTLEERGVTGAAMIAGWSDEDVAWWDENIEGFRGRVSRDEWVAQARALLAEDAAAKDAAGGDAAQKG
ncbi:MAG: hypothetical protein ACXIUV_10880 [Alkalilacustris sp.]